MAGARAIQGPGNGGVGGGGGSSSRISGSVGTGCRNGGDGGSQMETPKEEASTPPPDGDAKGGISLY